MRKRELELSFGNDFIESDYRIGESFDKTF